MRTTAKIIQIFFPLICLMTVILSWLGIELIDKNVELILLIVFYILAVAYLLTFYLFEASAISIVLIFIMYLSLLFLKVPFSWTIAIAMLPCIYIAFKVKKLKAAGSVIVILAGIITTILVFLSLLVNGFVSIQQTYYFSPNNIYAAKLYIRDEGALGGDEEIILYRNFSRIFIIRMEIIYENGRGWEENIPVRWIDNNTIEIDNDLIHIN